VVRAIRRRDVPAALRAYEEIQLWNGRWLAATVVGKRAGALALLSPALLRDPTDGSLRTLLGASLIEAGWRVRTYARAKDVSPERFAAFHQRLAEAEQVLAPATDIDPANLAAATLRITIARGLSMGLPEARSRYQAVARHDPHFPPAQRQLLRQLFPRWGGSTEEMYAFARERLDAAPPGSTVGVTIAEAHIDNWATMGSPRGWFKRPEIREELDKAAAKSVHHPDSRRGYDWVYAYNTFAFVYTRSGRYRDAAPLFKALGRYAENAPWSYGFSDPDTAFSVARLATMLRG